MRLFIKYLMLFSFPLILGAIAVFLMPLDKQFVYSEFLKGDCNERAKWIHDRIFLNARPIDVAFIGSSATWNAIDDRALTDSISSKFGKPISVANLGYCRPGVTLRIVFVEELIATKKPQIILLEVLPEPSNGSQPVFGFTASTRQLICPPTYAYQDWLSDVWKGLIVRWEQIRQLLSEDSSTYVIDDRSFGFGDNPAMADPVEMSRLLERRSRGPILKEPLLQDRLSYHLYWETLKEIERVCSKNRVKLAFYFINHYGRSSSVPMLLEEHKKIAPVWMLPDTVFQNPKNYFDPGHLNNVGAAQLTPTLLNNLYGLY